MALSQVPEQYVYVVEHLDPELEQWSMLEYNSASVAQGGSAIRIEHASVEQLFAGNTGSVCLLDPAASVDLCPEDGQKFRVFLFGGILGDNPPRDRTAELRNKGFEGRRLGPVQMTTDTAVRVTRMIIQGKASLDAIKYIDHPEIQVNEHEWVQMPFRYVKGTSGQPIMPGGMIELIKRDSKKGLEDLL